MSKFKVGDRIAIYNNGLKFLGSIETVAADGRIQIKNDSMNSWWHPKQCRRLKPRAKAREFEINIRADGVIRGVVQAPASAHDPLGAFYSDNETIHVREVRKKC